MKNIHISNLILGVLLLGSCQKDTTTTAFNYALPTPSNFPAPIYDFSKNPITPEGFALGRRLFYDPLLSRDGFIACGDCHISHSAFSHPDHATSHGIGGQFGRRNAPAMQNLAWRKSFFWDGGVPHLDLVPLNAIQNPVEMDEKPVNIVRKLNQHAQYPALFRAAFGTKDTVTGALMLRALSQFMGRLVSANSRYDHYVRQEQGGTFTDEEKAGHTLFQQKCATCHATDLFTDQTFRNNGLETDFTLDKGRQEVSTFTEDIGKFAVPSLRNIEKTAPYMHDGRFRTLEQVLEHYANGVQRSATLDPLLQQNGRLGIALSALERQQLVTFLKTLADEDFLKEPTFQQQ